MNEHHYYPPPPYYYPQFGGPRPVNSLTMEDIQAAKKMWDELENQFKNKEKEKKDKEKKPSPMLDRASLVFLMILTSPIIGYYMTSMYLSIMHNWQALLK